MFTEQLIPSNQSYFHLVLGLQSVQMLEEVHFRQFSLHFLHTFASVGETKHTSVTRSAHARPGVPVICPLVTVVQVVAVPADRRARAAVLDQMVTLLTGGALVAAAPGAALAGGVAFLATAAVGPEPAGTLGDARPVART